MSTHHISVTINGTSYEGDVDSRTLLVHWIRDTLRLTGTHIGCDTTSCGACTILVDGKATKSCTMFAVQADGRQLMTVEGLEQNANCILYRRDFTRSMHCNVGIALQG